MQSTAERVALCSSTVFAHIALFATASTGGAQPPRAAERATLSARVDSIAEHFIHSAPTPGLTLGVVRGRDTIVLRGYGEADRLTHRAASASTSYRIGSMTKQFTAAAVLQLVEQGSLALEDTLGDILPQFPAWRGVRIRQLLNHSSGILPFNTAPQWLQQRTQYLSPDSVLSIIASAPLTAPPGTRLQYNNSGYLLLGQVIEARSGMSLAEFFRARFFAPLGMTSARFCRNDPATTDDARGSDIAPTGTVEADPIDVATFGGAGALCMTVPDFLTWQTALTDGRIISTAMYQRMSRSDTLANGRATGLGWGLMPRRLEGRAMVAHGGDINGFGAEQLWFPNDSLRVIVFTNAFNVGPANLAEDVARAVLDLSPRSKSGVVAPATRAAIAGSYALRMPTGDTVRMTLWSAGERLMAKLESPGQQAFPLSDRGDGEFWFPAAPALRIRVQLENGRGTQLELRQNGLTLTGPRVMSPGEGATSRPHTNRQ